MSLACGESQYAARLDMAGIRAKLGSAASVIYRGCAARRPLRVRAMPCLPPVLPPRGSFPGEASSMGISDPAARRKRARARSWAILVAWVILLWAAMSAVRAHAAAADTDEWFRSQPTYSAIHAAVASRTRLD